MYMFCNSHIGHCPSYGLWLLWFLMDYGFEHTNNCSAVDRIMALQSVWTTYSLSHIHMYVKSVSLVYAINQSAHKVLSQHTQPVSRMTL